MRFNGATFFLTIDDIRAGYMKHSGGILFFTERKIILQAMILVHATGCSAGRYVTDNKSHLQANKIVRPIFVRKTKRLLMTFNAHVKIMILACVLCFCSCLFKVKRDLTILLNENPPYFILNDDKFPYKGTQIDSVFDHIQNTITRCWENEKKTGNDKNYYTFRPQKCLVICSGDQEVSKLINLRIVFDIYDWSTPFDLKIDNTLVHIRAVLSYPGGSIVTVDGKHPDDYWDKKWACLRILCNPSRFIILKDEDTLFNGNYNQINEMKCKSLLNPNNIAKTSSFPLVKDISLVYLNPTCNTPLKNIAIIAACFPNSDHIYFELGRGFTCSDSLTDIREHNGDIILKRPQSQ